jgi:hypothetical protein
MTNAQRRAAYQATLPPAPRPANFKELLGEYFAETPEQRAELRRIAKALYRFHFGESK